PERDVEILLEGVGLPGAGEIGLAVCGARQRARWRPTRCAPDLTNTWRCRTCFLRTGIGGNCLGRQCQSEHRGWNCRSDQIQTCTSSRHKPSAFWAGLSEKLNSTASCCTSWATGLQEGTTKISFGRHAKELLPTRLVPCPSTAQ